MGVSLSRVGGDTAAAGGFDGGPTVGSGVRFLELGRFDGGPVTGSGVRFLEFGMVADDRQRRPEKTMGREKHGVDSREFYEPND
jgi:hypothetical protein